VALMAGAVAGCDAPTAPSEPAPAPEAATVADHTVAVPLDVLVDPWLGALVQAHADPLLHRALHDAVDRRSPATIGALRSLAIDRAGAASDPDAELAAAVLILALESSAPSR
jgi:hypothetical protein